VSVKKIDADRWSEAQRWEFRVWQEAQTKRGWRRLLWPIAKPLLAVVGSDRGRGDDWNGWWAERFERYQLLPDELGEYIELGCGPYTNTRLILRGRTATRIVCSDPLIRSYLHFNDAWLSQAYSRGLVSIDDHPLEECPFAPSTFDVVVLINVLDHVYDADLCLERATNLVRPGGYFLLGQDLSNEEDEHIEDRVDDPRDRIGYSVGHPIRLAEEDLTPHLREFDEVLRKTLSRAEGRVPVAHYGTLIFAGRKRQGLPRVTASGGPGDEG
jgi:SAM-dependent methyltransferase